MTTESNVDEVEEFSGDKRDTFVSEFPRSIFGGALMGLANLVPGISGGTMLLAAGIYPKFINAIADVTKFRFRYRSLFVLGTVVLSAVIAIFLGAGVLKNLVVSHRWIMYSIFIGLTLGGFPLVWKLVRPLQASTIVSCSLAFAGMVGIAILQAMNVVGTSNGNIVMYLVAGLAGASAMILPGLSGGYILLLLGQYVPILSAIDEFKEALKARDLSTAMDPALSVMLPVGIGVVLGVAIVGNLVQWLLNKYRKATLGVLLGLLLGSTVGLWPFQRATEPTSGQTVKGVVVTEENKDSFDPEDWPTEYFAPSATQGAGAIVLIVVGFGLTAAISRIGGDQSAT